MLSSNARIALAVMLDWLKTTLLAPDRKYHTCQKLMAPIKNLPGRPAYVSSATGASAVLFQSLPPELLHMIASHLPSSSLIALKLTSKRFFHAVRAPPAGWMKTAPSCEKKAARRYLRERGDDRAGRRRCVTCGLVGSAASFPFPFPICSAHDQWFLSTTIPSFAEDALRRRLVRAANQAAAARWIAIDRVYCMHTRDIVGWHVAECQCDCASCGHFPVKCYVRVTGTLGNPKYVEIAEDKRSVIEESWIQESSGALQLHQRSVPVVSLADT